MERGKRFRGEIARCENLPSQFLRHQIDKCYTCLYFDLKNPSSPAIRYFSFDN